MLSYLELQRLTAQAAGLTIEELVGQRKHKSLVRARHIAMLLCRDELGMSYPQIGFAFGQRDHTTAINGVRSARQRLEQGDLFYRELIDDVQLSLGSLRCRPLASCRASVSTCRACVGAPREPVPTKLLCRLDNTETGEIVRGRPLGKKRG